MYPHTHNDNVYPYAYYGDLYSVFLCVCGCVLYESTCIRAYIFIPHSYSRTNTNNWPTMDSRHHLQVGFHECSCWHVWWVCLRLSQDIKRASLSSPSLQVTLLKLQVLLSDLSAPCIITSHNLTIPHYTLPYLTANTSCILFVPLNGDLEWLEWQLKNVAPQSRYVWFDAFEVDPHVPHHPGRCNGQWDQDMAVIWGDSSDCD